MIFMSGCICYNHIQPLDLRRIKMVVKIKYKGEEVYQCEECKLIYKDKKWAKECEKWCKENHTCNVEITKHRLKEKEQK